MPDRRVFVAVFVLVIVIGGSWAAAHFVRPLPEPRWTSSDLPPLPPERDNVYALLDGRLTPPDLDSLVVEDGDDVDSILAEARTRHSELRAALEPTRELRAEIRRRPRFVEAGGLLGRSHVLEGMTAWKLRSLSVLNAVLQREHDAAAEEVASMWTQAVDYSTHCQSMLSCLVGQRLQQLALGSAELLAQRSPRDLRWLARLIDSSTPDRSAISHGIVAEYVYARVALETHDAPLLDRAHTDALIRDHFSTALDFARDPANPRPVADFREGALWWLYNPAGKRLASGATVQHLDDLIERYVREADAIAIRRDETTRAMRSLPRRATHRTTLQLPRIDPRAMPTLHAPEPFGSCEGK